ncbi:N-acetylmuramoyl-L-alanine amidase [Deinococcus alpinitundrae]|uniref:N-acetylmuramoyl-L-alanine amidase n=1 Tax=Deinococcus alpinitundrae TaxID=468913 RepID=UPI001ED91508|nr:peptidoglycan recognition family protein [Deinococcus alpinitundrae]
MVCHVADGTLKSSAAWFADPKANVSAHYIVGMDGSVIQSVQELDAAYHAGLWPMNLRSIGIEHEGEPRSGPWTPSEAQLQASAELVGGVCKRYSIPVNRLHITGHNEVQPDRSARKGCPGPTWPWARYLSMVAAAVNPQPAHQPAHQPSPDDKRTVLLFDPATNQQVGTGTLINGTDKIYVTPR